MKSYTINKPLLFRVTIIVTLLVFTIIMTKFVFTTKLYRCVAVDNMKHIQEMSKVQAHFTEMWDEYRQKVQREDDQVGTGEGQSYRPEEIMRRLKIERDLLSQQLNEMWKMVGRLQCEWSGDITTGEGGWCQKASSEDSGYHMTDKGLVTAISSLLKSRSVGSFGDGPGAYKREILRLGEVKSFDSYDGAPFSEETSWGQVQFLDLTLPQYNIPVYDFILSLEVAEHIPPQYESTYLDNLCRHARMGIILSWAVPGQGGLSHVNNRPLHYVSNRLKERGFVLHQHASQGLQDASSVEWLKRNVNVYVRSNYSQTSDKWKTLFNWFS